MPKVSLYHVKKKQDILLLTGDVQPLDEKDCYDFCEKLIDLCEEYKCKNLITLGGIGLPRIPKKIKTYVTGSDKKYIKEFVSKNLNDQIFGVVGPIVGVTGLLIGLGSKRKMKGVSLLAQTYGHPNYLGIKGSKALLDILNKKLILGLDLKKLDKEIKELEKEIEDEDVEIVEEDTNLMFNPRETRYIG